MNKKIKLPVTQWCPLLLLSVLGTCHADGGDAWQFVRLRENATSNPAGWETHSGTATVRIDGNHIHIEAFDILGPKEPSIIIDGSVDSAGNITATGTRTHTDERPFALSGSLRTWSNDFTAVTDHVRRRIEYREILFPLHPHYEFYGFLTSTTREL